MRARRNSRKGNAFLEMAFVLLPLLALICGIVDFSMVLYLKAVFQDAVNQAARFAITYNMTYKKINGTTVSCSTQQQCILEVLYDNSSGLLSSTKNRNKNNQLMVYVDWYTPANLGTPATASPVNATGNVVEVRIQDYLWDWIMPLFAYIDLRQPMPSGPPAAFRLAATATDVMQSLPVGVLAYPTAR